MARTELERAVLPSLWDRLTDEDPRAPADPPTTREASLRRFRDGVLRDVELLLNARRTPVASSLAERSALGRSVFAFGLPETTGLAIASKEGRALLQRWVQETLETFEPRLAQVRVRMTDVDQGSAPQVRFAVEALLRMDPSPERVLFDTVLDLSRGEYAVAEGAVPAA